MKIAITATGPSLEDQVDPRFGRCQYFLIVNTDTLEYEAVENPNISIGGGAGIQSAQLMAEKGVKTILTGNCGPNAFNVFGSAGIQVIVGVSGIAKQAVLDYKAGKLSATTQANVTSHFGMGMGGDRGMGMGRGMGRGMGMGRGRGVWMVNPTASAVPGTQMTKEQELEYLKQDLKSIDQQKKDIENKISDIENGQD